MRYRDEFHGPTPAEEQADYIRDLEMACQMSQVLIQQIEIQADQYGFKFSRVIEGKIDDVKSKLHGVGF